MTLDDPRPDHAAMTSRLEQLCLDKGLKMTEQRRVIARVLSESADHPDVEQVYRRATAIDSHISIATVYRTVRLFENAGVAGIHLEDQELPKRCGHLSGKHLVEPGVMAAKVRAAKAAQC